VARGTSSHVSQLVLFSLSLSLSLSLPLSLSVCLSRSRENHGLSLACGWQRERTQQQPAFVRSASRLPARAAAAKKSYDDLIHAGYAFLLVHRVTMLLAVLKTSPASYEPVPTRLSAYAMNEHTRSSGLTRIGRNFRTNNSSKLK
jgi:hypothetical protein